jgi:hypothetical protein
MPVALLIGGSLLLGFVLMWPVGWLFATMSWPMFHAWGLAHGSWIVAWPVLSVLSFLALYAIGAMASRRSPSGPGDAP